MRLVARSVRYMYQEQVADLHTDALLNLDAHI